MGDASLGILVAAVLVGYLVGSASPAALVARARGVDLRTSGSGNPGATNAGRVMGRPIGYLVGVADVLKGLLPALGFGLWGGPVPAMVAGLSAVVGHVTSPWLRGHGGKGVATSFGAILGVAPVWGGLGLLVFAVVVLLTRWVALGSVTAAVMVAVLAVVAWLAPSGWVAAEAGSWGTAAPPEGLRVAWAAALALIVIGRHRRNLVARIRRRRSPA